MEIAAWEMPFGVMVALILGCQLLSRAKKSDSSTTTMYSCNDLFSGLVLLVEDICGRRAGLHRFGLLG